MRQASLVRRAVRPGGPGLHDLRLGGRVHRALLVKIGIGAAMKTERANAVLMRH